MKIAVRRSPTLLAPCLLATALSLCMAAPVFARNLGGGASHTVVAGDAKEDWQVNGASTLNLAAGATAGIVSIRAQSTLNATDAQFSGSDAYLLLIVNSNASILRSSFRNDAGYGLTLGALQNTPSAPHSIATLDASTVEGLEAAVLVNGNGQLTVSGSTLIGKIDTSLPNDPSNGVGLWVVAGGAVIQSNSSARGDLHGANLISEHMAGFTTQPSTLIVDGSRLEGMTGSAIYVGPSFSNDTDVDITLRNGAELVAGNGVLIDIQPNTSSPALKVHADVDVSNSQLRGDIRAGTGATGSLALRDNASLVGGMTGAIDVALSQGGQWQLNKSSDVANLAVENGGVVALGDGSAFHTLNVAGNFTGNGGTLAFNTVLAGDDAATDKLIIGGDTSGTANVRVNNVGGAGAQTNQGIQLIQVGGASNGQFNLAGRAVGGQYEYFLFKGTGADGNWYLRSQLPTQPDPCEVDPTLPECNPETPDPVLRPEPGAYLANLQAAQNMFRLGYHDRHAGQNSGRAWARVDGSRNGFDAISRQLDIHGNSQALTVGADLWRHESGSSAGVMLSSGNATSTSTNELSGYYARGKVKGEALGIYGTWRGGNGADPYAGFYVDGSLQRAQFRNRVEGIGLAAERYDSRAWQGAVETGYAFRVGGASNGGLYLEPQLQVGYSRWDSNRHTEANGTVVGAENANGMFGRVGLRLSGVTRWGNGAAEVQPYLAANWLHTRAESQIRMDDELVDARIPRSRGEFSGGASVKFSNGIGAWGGLSLQRASGYHQTSAQVGVSYSW
ncbi:autotransporter outer membrane beta-barrel domain-containing protein [Stenotrophomonas maltophilia]|uniref:autotransporter family protein n=1 Tax=Stenotrophomonas maltophilia TaxID=40324 RepID=UPI0022F3D083|nr:autotransporter outer membrane beta-barrel domain-containing protein [Stenotrophomonas maltophilia]MDA5343646.1 autotransporter outer membrane beta-barrel domain-containing protein [Stenotrophomonas maltophilia]